MAIYSVVCVCNVYPLIIHSSICAISICSSVSLLSLLCADFITNILRLLSCLMLHFLCISEASHCDCRLRPFAFLGWCAFVVQCSHSLPFLHGSVTVVHLSNLCLLILLKYLHHSDPVHCVSIADDWYLLLIYLLCTIEVPLFCLIMFSFIFWKWCIHCCCVTIVLHWFPPYTVYSRDLTVSFCCSIMIDTMWCIICPLL